MAKLHELLAVEGNLKAQAEKTRNELMNSFKNKQHLFTGLIQTFRSVDEGVPEVTEKALKVNSTVPKELKWISKFLGQAIDVGYQVAEANTEARADVVLDDGTTLLKGIPATSLLELERRLNEIKDLILAVPTLDPAAGFEAAPDQGEGVYKARDENKTRTRKVKKVIELAKASDKHPAQVQLVDLDEKHGDITVKTWSGFLPVADKGYMIDRCEEVLRAVKKARSRANEQQIEVGNKKIAAEILKHIFAV